jgi:hypothetical protein
VNRRILLPLLATFVVTGCNSEPSFDLSDCDHFYDLAANYRASAVEARASGDSAGYDFYMDEVYSVVDNMPEICK